MASAVKRTRIRLSIIFGVAVFLFFCVSRSGWEGQAPVVAAVLFFVGILLVGLATIGRAWCSLYIAGYKNKALVVDGPYSISRNPLYLFSLIGLVGVGLCSETLLIPTILVIGFALYYPGVIRKEENKLLELYAQDCRDYMATTPRFFPRLSQLREPKQYTVNPKVFRKHVFESMLFVWIVGMLELAEALQHVGWIHTVLKIY
jgi:protein-S-isoprenylcysteine O-methyltransferase Ste14